jgi:sarcosine oxidase subunit beta
VVLLEQGIAGDGSTGRSSGGLRTQFTTAYEIALSRLSRTFYEHLETDPTFPGGIRRVGYVFLADSGHLPVLRHAYAAQRDNAVPVQWLEPGELHDAYPYCATSGIVAATRTADDGFIDPWDVHQWVVRRARESGAVLRQHTPVQLVQATGSCWVVHAGQTRVRADRIIVAAGAWTGAIGDRIGARLPVHASPRVKVLTGAHPELPTDMPLITDLASGAYVRSELGHALVGAKPVAPTRGFTIDTSLDHLAAIMSRASTRFPSLENAGIAGSVSGLYEVTPDGLPLAGPVDGHRGLWVVAGFNGHGIMHGPAVADGVAAALTGTDTGVDIAPLAPSRFARGNPPVGTSLL